MSSLTARLHFAALLVAGALSVHELRYVLAFGRHADRAASEQGHAYLSILIPVVVVAVALAAAQLAVRLSRRRRVDALAPSLACSWTVASVALVAAYVTQEWVEGALASGHATGIAGIVGHGGWMAFVLAVALGGLIALALRGTAASSERSPQPLWLCAPHPPACSTSPPAWRRPSLHALARNLAGRGPPPISG